MEQNEMVVIFSSGELAKANTSASVGQVPRAMSIDHFNKWLAEMRIKDKNIQIINKSLTIKN